MPKIGMRHVVIAPLNVETETHGKPLTYTAGMVATRAVAADITYNRSDSSFYADDVLAESDNAVTGVTVSITGAEFLPEARVMAFGVKKVSGDTGGSIYRTTAAPAPYIGLGYMTVLVYKGQYKYTGHWIHKVQMALGSETARTKGETIEWQDETATGTAVGVYIDDSGEAAFVDEQEFESAALAQAWLDKKAGISG